MKSKEILYYKNWRTVLKLKKSTVIILVSSWILFLAVCISAYLKLDLLYAKKITNEKISRKQTQENQREKEQQEKRKKVQAFMSDYYQWIQKNDRENLKKVTQDFQMLKKQQKKFQQYVEKYQNLSYRVEEGPNNQSYIVYVTYELKIKGISTPAPGLSVYGVEEKGNSFFLYNNENREPEEITAAKEESLSNRETKELIAKVSRDYEKAKKSDKKLEKFLKGSQIS